MLAQVSANWVESFAEGLPLECCASLLKAYGDLPEDVQSKVIAYFDTGFTATAMPDRFGELYALAAANISSKSWGSGLMHDHLDRSLSRLPSRVSRPVEELDDLLGGLSKYISTVHRRRSQPVCEILFQAPPAIRLNMNDFISISPALGRLPMWCSPVMRRTPYSLTRSMWADEAQKMLGAGCLALLIPWSSWGS